MSVNVFIVGGTGLIGSALKQMMLKGRGNSGVVLVGYCNSKTGVKLTKEGNEEVTTWGGAYKFDDSFIANCADGGEICIADCTASEDVSNLYPVWLAKGWHVATPNKKCNSGPMERYKACLDAATSGKSKWFVEATIGAGLPIVSTLRTLRATGDEIQSVQGIFSGTMSFLFNTWDAVSPFSEIVGQAKQAGYTEPDPRDDLNGMDVARKVVIAARESGLEISLQDVSIESLVPAELESCSADEFMAKFKDHDAKMTDMAAKAAADGNVLRFVGSVDVPSKKAEVKLAAFSKSHPFAGLSGADNILEIQTSRYGPLGSSTPLIIRGPGAGADVTAAGVYGDIIAIASTK
mmetsp:Transcript_19259/g.24828  ORF Transcript_19259/g.24828 Transcript_19259/m.24828 type:complete len:349 (+) Transcript_19259:160-1206(+)|eukprot:CAMPEP_0198149126 /NCGR_PEP_ID=MMETSP1443-20131203/45144_1 /TAXON_ID=186043 /ORGANISM="Entomoneis sp., Strain CCMP2396" /LENGTH=348 /DNA_ID=CAMNT_0043814055 /DNA_START=86 /DNA_END=1132 /DNA_ORIENTATION=+